MGVQIGSKLGETLGLMMPGMNKQISTIASASTNSANQVCGVRWDASQSSPVLTRLGYAAGKNAGADFTAIYPWSQMKMCNVDDSGNIKAFYGDAGFARDGSNGEVMVLIPKFYYKHTYDVPTKVHAFWISPVGIDGFKLHPCFLRGGAEKPYIFHSAYEAGIDGSSKITSRTGTIPKVSATRANFGTYATNRGAKWQQQDIMSLSAITFLILIEYATLYLDTVIGKGICELNYNAADTATDTSTAANTFTTTTVIAAKFIVGQMVGCGSSLGGNQVFYERQITNITGGVITVDGTPFNTVIGSIIYNTAQKTGACDSLNGATGMAAGTNGKVSVSYRGIENPWGNIWKFVSGINIKNDEKQPYFASGNFAEGVYTGNYSASGLTLPAANGYVKNLGYSQIADWMLAPIEVGGGSTTYVPDYYYQNWADTNGKILLAGGNWTTGVYAGLLSWTVAYTASNADLYIGSRALCIP